MTEVHGSVDHLIYGTPDLERGVEEIERRLDVRPAAGGRHPQWGTRNALLSLGPETYFEVIAPDPELPEPEEGILFGLDGLKRPGLVTWALRTEDIEETAGRAREQGVELGPIRSGSREQPDGAELTWRLTEPSALPMDGAVPFLLDWGDTPHPGGSAPRAGELVGLRVRHPWPDDVREALRALGAEDVRVERGRQVELVATIRTERGDVEIR